MCHHKGEPFYNLPYIYVLDRSLDGERMLAAIETAFKAHPTLFTRIGMSDQGEPLQTLDMDNEQWSLGIEDITDIEEEKTRLVVPFDIDGGRLFHVNLMRNQEHYYLFLDYHHIIVDGTSMQIMLQDEFGLTQPIDPSGGSWAVESLTKQIKEKIWAEFQNIEAKELVRSL